MPRNAPLNALYWPYGTHGIHDEPNVSEVLKEINGRDLNQPATAQKLPDMKNDGSTASRLLDLLRHSSRGASERRQQARSDDYLGHGWGFSWPNDVRILYNRCSARPDGKPWSERKKLVWWDEDKAGMDRRRRPDFDKKKRPDYQPTAARRAWMPSPATSRSSCIPTESPGCSSPAD